MCMCMTKILGSEGPKTANLYRAIKPAQPATKEKQWQFINKTLVKKVNILKSDISNNPGLNDGASYLGKLLSQSGALLLPIFSFDVREHTLPLLKKSTCN